MKQEIAETIALNALGWLAGNDDLLPVFLGASGASSDDMRARANEPEFLGSILDFIMNDDAWVVAFCDEFAMNYDQPMRARQALPGGRDVSWT